MDQKEKKNVVFNDSLNDFLLSSTLLRPLFYVFLYIYYVLQINNYLQRKRNEVLGSSRITIEEVQRWILDNMAVPDTLDKPFIADYRVVHDADKTICLDVLTESKTEISFIITTRRLIETNAVNADIIHADTTYKVNASGFPLTVVGVSDKNGTLHLLGFAITTSEKTEDYKFIFSTLKDISKKLTGVDLQPTTLVSDASLAIRNAYKSEFLNDNTIICSFHFFKNCRERPLDNPENREKIMHDLGDLQLAGNRDQFGKASKLFIEKWMILEPTFTKYFEKQWVLKNNTWYEGYQLLTPKTNNCVEGLNSRIKRDFTYRERKLFQLYKENLVRMTTDYSIQVTQKPFQDDVSISDSL